MKPSTVLVLATLAAAAVTAPAFAQDVEKGQKIFAKCKACHQVGPTAKNGVGPELNGIVGRVTATAPDFKYSDALAAKGAEGHVWTKEELALWVADPKALIPGNKMVFVGLKRPDDVANLVAYLETLK